MERSNGYRMRLVLVGFVAAIVFSGENAKADFTFGEPTNLGPPVNSAAYESGSNLSADGLSLYFRSDRPGGYGGQDLWLATRPTTNDAWEDPVNLGPVVNNSYNEGQPNISVDALTLYFNSNQPGGYGDQDLWLATRPTTNGPWGEPVNLGPTVNSSANDAGSSISTDGLSLYFHSLRPGGYGGGGLWVTTRATTEDEWSNPVNLGPAVNSSTADRQPNISADGLWLFLHSDRPGGYGGQDLWLATRPTTNDPWGEPVNLGPTVNGPARDAGPSLSVDGRTLYFNSDRPGGIGDNDIWQASIEPVVDLNGDGIVDAADMCIMIDHWSENYSLCDIGPMPWGDGVVDVHDLVVLAEHLFTYPGAVAHWALDEADGDIAYDSAGNNDGIVNSGPHWQPTGGQIDGALAFDGTDDYVSSEFVLNPADGVFSVVAWIMGGAPGQVVISQAGGGNWLLTDPQAGALMTELKGSGRTGGPLLSQTVIINGDWHRICLVWDGSYRILYVDGTEVAKDTQAQAYLEGVNGGLYLGAGSTLEPGSFFSGLIDDVRIYDRAVTP